jgi:hypothetical protein
LQELEKLVAPFRLDVKVDHVGRVDSELSCPVLVAHQMSATSGFVLPRGRGGQAGGLSMPSTRRAAERI